MFLPLLPGDSPGEIGDARAALATIRNLPGVSGAVGVTSWQLERGVEGPRGDIPAPLAAVVGVTGDAERIPNQILLSHGRCSGTALVVGTLLAAINHGGDIAAGAVTFGVLWKVALTYAVPFAVSLWATIGALRQRRPT